MGERKEVLSMSIFDDLHFHTRVAICPYNLGGGKKTTGFCSLVARRRLWPRFVLQSPSQYRVSAGV